MIWTMELKRTLSESENWVEYGRYPNEQEARLDLLAVRDQWPEFAFGRIRGFAEDGTKSESWQRG